MNQYFRMPIANGDNNIWSTYLLAQIKSNTGEYSSYLYDDAGTLKVSPGRIGISDGTTQGTAIIDTATTITITGTNGRWYKIEMTVAGTAVTFASTVLADADAAILPATLTGSYITTKQGFYHVATKRLLGVVWKDSAGVLGGVVNCQNMIKGYYGYAYLNTTKTAIIRWDKKQESWNCEAEYQIGDWNMDAVADAKIDHYLSDVTVLKLDRCRAIIHSDPAGVKYFRISNLETSDIPGLAAGWIMVNDSSNPVVPGTILLGRTPASQFDDSIYNATSYNRGFVYLGFKE